MGEFPNGNPSMSQWGVTTATATGHRTALSPADTDTPSLRHFNQMQFFVDLCILVFKSVKSTNKRSKPKALLFLTAH